MAASLLRMWEQASCVRKSLFTVILFEQSHFYVSSVSKCCANSLLSGEQQPLTGSFLGACDLVSYSLL